jgi:signal transduction histidine kinase
MSDLDRLFNADAKIEKVTQKLFQIDLILREICEEIKSSFEFDFAAISLVDKERNIIEAVQGTQEVRWINLAKHYLEEDPDLRDIQADIYYTRNIEIISGNDDRFDDYIYESCNHKDFIRVFLPILVIESDNDQDRFVRDWFESAILINNPPDMQKPESEGQHQRYQMEIPQKFHDSAQVIGTVEAGYFNAQRQIPEELVRRLTGFVAQRALQIWEARLADVLKVIVTETKEVTEADSATLHYLYKPSQTNFKNSPYVYEELAGFLRRDYLNNCPPRSDGLGDKAIKTNEPQWISQSEELKEQNSGAYKAGLRAMAAFPLKVSDETGILYISHTQIHKFNDTEIQRGQFLARRAIEAIRYARSRRQAQYRDKQLTTLHEIAQSLLDVQQEGTLLRLIAGNTRNILAADVVTIYEFIQSEECFLTPPDIAGKLKAQESTSGEGHRLGVPLWLIAQEHNLYASILNEHEVFQESHFDKQENIHSVAGVKLKVGSEVVGVMFINYRRLHDFSQEEQQFIETLASHAAIAIKNRRSRDKWLENLVQIDRQIITALDQTEDALLKLVVERAVQVTGADLGEILMPNLVHEELLEVKSSYPSDVVHTIRTIQPGEGFTGQVAIDRQSRLINDVQSDPQYIEGRTNIGSEVCVPLLDQHHQLLGILNVGSCRKNAFTQRHQRSLEGLATRAVIGIQTLKNNERLRKTSAAKLLAFARFQILHMMKNDLGAIQLRASEICVDSAGATKDKAQRILTSVERMREDLVSTRNSNLDSLDKQGLNFCDLVSALNDALERVELPPGIEVQTTMPDFLPRLCSGKQILIEIFDNLIRNAKEAMQGQNQGSLSIKSEVFDGVFGCRVKIEVCDTGIGISTERVEEIFEPGFSTKNNGMGVGLSIVQSYIESLGGIITADNQLGGGARFTVLLPAEKMQVS